MKKNNRYIYCFSLVGIVLIIVGIFIYMYQYKNEKEIYKSESSIDSSYKYILKEYDKKIGVFEKDKDTPIRVIDISVETLPDYDIENLKNGIIIKDDVDLNRIIEDFDS